MADHHLGHMLILCSFNRSSKAALRKLIDSGTTDKLVIYGTRNRLAKLIDVKEVAALASKGKIVLKKVHGSVVRQGQTIIDEVQKFVDSMTCTGW